MEEQKGPNSENQEIESTIKDTTISKLMDKLSKNTNEIDLSGMNFGDKVAIAIAEVLKTNNKISTIDLSSNNISNKGAIAIANAMKENPKIVRVYLNNNKIGNEGAKAFAEVIELKKGILSRISFSNNKIEDEGAEAFANALAKSEFMNYIRLDRNKIGSKGAKALAEALKINKKIIDIDISNNNIGDEGAEALADALKKNHILSRINLSGNEIGVAGAQELADTLEINKKMVCIDLSNNDIGDEGAEKLAAALKKNDILNTINLSGNKIGVAGAKALAEALKINKKITNIDISNNNIGDEGAEELANALKENDILNRINLSGNKIGVAGAMAIIESLEENYTLETIDLSSNKMDDIGAVTITKDLVNYGLESVIKIVRNACKAISESPKVHKGLIIKLNDNNIDNKVMEILFDALNVNDRLKLVELNDNNIGNEAAGAIDNLLKIHNGLKIKLGGNNIKKVGATAITDAINNHKSSEDQFLDHVYDNIKVLTGLNMAIDIARTLYNPTKENLYKTSYDASLFASSYSGAYPVHSSMLSVLTLSPSVVKDIWEGEYLNASYKFAQNIILNSIITPIVSLYIFQHIPIINKNFPANAVLPFVGSVITAISLSYNMHQVYKECKSEEFHQEALQHREEVYDYIGSVYKDFFTDTYIELTLDSCNYLY